MASLVQSNVGTLQGTGNTLAVAYTSNNTAGNLLVAKIWVGSNNTVSSFSDSAGNTWVQQRNDPETVINTHFYSYYCLSAIGGSNTVTIVVSANTFAALYIVEASSGVGGTTWSTDGTTATLGPTAGTASDSGPITTVGTNDFMVSQVNMSTASTVTPGTGWTTAVTDVFGNTTQYRAVASAGTYDSTATFVTTASWYSDITAFQATGSSSINPTVSGTVSVTGSVNPTLTPAFESLSGNLGVTGTQNVQFDYFPSLAGTVSVSGSVNPGLSTFSFSGTINLTGSVALEFGFSVAGTAQVTGTVIPGVTQQFLPGTIAVSGVVVPTLSPTFVSVSGPISVSGAVHPTFAPSGGNKGVGGSLIGAYDFWGGGFN